MYLGDHRHKDAKNLWYTKLIYCIIMVWTTKLKRLSTVPPAGCKQKIISLSWQILKSNSGCYLQMLPFEQKETNKLKAIWVEIQWKFLQVFPHVFLLIFFVLSPHYQIPEVSCFKAMFPSPKWHLFQYGWMSKVETIYETRRAVSLFLQMDPPFWWAIYSPKN